MAYVVGQTYRHVSHLKDGSPVYVTLTIAQVHADHLVLSNGTRIDFIPVDLGKERGKDT